MKMNHRKISLAASRRVFVTLFSACLLAAHSSAQTPTTWNGGTADWENAAFWNNGVPNSPSADAFIDGGKTGIASVVTMQNSKTVGRLTLDAGDTLNLGSGTNFTIQAGAFGGSGSIINNGEIDFSNGGSLNILFFGNTSISGTGTINLFAAGSAFGQNIYSPNGVGDRLTIGAGQTITGSTSSNNGGSLGGGQSTFTNNGTINANTSLDAFVIAPGGGNGNDFTNGPTGIAEASNGGVLVLFGGNFNNGTFQALDNSQVLIQTSALSGATLTTAGSGTIKISSGLITLTNVTNTGTLNFGQVTATLVGGTLVNTGTINLSDGFSGNILYDGDTSISVRARSTFSPPAASLAIASDPQMATVNASPLAQARRSRAQRAAIMGAAWVAAIAPSPITAPLMPTRAPILCSSRPAAATATISPTARLASRRLPTAAFS